MSILPVPIVAAVIGEGGSGGALAFGVADRILMQENAIYSVIAPEGAAAILYHDAQRARDLADALKLTAADCKLLGVVDTLVPEPEGGAHLDPDYAALLLRNFVLDALLELRKTSPRRLVDERYRKFRRMGSNRQPRGASRSRTRWTSFSVGSGGGAGSGVGVPGSARWVRPRAAGDETAADEPATSDASSAEQRRVRCRVGRASGSPCWSGALEERAAVAPFHGLEVEPRDDGRVQVGLVMTSIGRLPIGRSKARARPSSGRSSLSAPSSASRVSLPSGKVGERLSPSSGRSARRSARTGPSRTARGRRSEPRAHGRVARRIGPARPMTTTSNGLSDAEIGQDDDRRPGPQAGQAEEHDRRRIVVTRSRSANAAELR